ncbi:MAG: HAD family hydrolase [Pseudomonadota bacterium]
MTQRLAIFDLDNTLLTGDSEVLWLDFLRQRGLLDAAMAERNADMDRRYHAGTVAPDAFCSFYAALFAGRTPQQWQPLLDGWFSHVIAPRIPEAAHALVQQHRDADDLPVLSTASGRILAEPSARALGFEHLIATELALLPDGCLAGRTEGTLNMREGKVLRLHSWLAARGVDADAVLSSATFYSDSINDLPLLQAVGHPVVVDPDPRLLAEAQARAWPVLQLARNPLATETT